MIEKPEVGQLIDYVKSKGKAGSRTVEILSKNYKFLTAFQTEVGYELLKDLCSRHETLLGKVSDMEVTDAEKMEYKVVKDLILKWSDRISAYYGAVKTVNDSK